MSDEVLNGKRQSAVHKRALREKCRELIAEPLCFARRNWPQVVLQTMQEFLIRVGSCSLSFSALYRRLCKQYKNFESALDLRLYDEFPIRWTFPGGTLSSARRTA